MVYEIEIERKKKSEEKERLAVGINRWYGGSEVQNISDFLVVGRMPCKLKGCIAVQVK